MIVLCWFLSGMARATIVMWPLHHFRSWLGEPRLNRPQALNVELAQGMLAQQIGKITALVCKYTPWKSECLVQAMVAAWWLRRYRIPYTIYLGAMKGGAERELMAHAWLKVGRAVITGREGHNAYPVLLAFVYPARADGG